VQNLILDTITYKAIAMLSGGLDSLLAAKVIQDPSIHVEGHAQVIRKKDKGTVKRNKALWVAEQLGIKSHIVDIVEEYKDIVVNLRHGYVANVNSGLDCEIFMVQKAPVKPLVTEKMLKEWLLA
jgi:tRNA-specific 2-thiouridylase